MHIDDGEPATANRRDRDRDLALPQANRCAHPIYASYSPYIYNALILEFHESACAVLRVKPDRIILSGFDLNFSGNFFGRSLRAL